MSSSGFSSWTGPYSSQWTPTTYSVTGVKSSLAPWRARRTAAASGPRGWSGTSACGSRRGTNRGRGWPRARGRPAAGPVPARPGPDGTRTQTVHSAPVGPTAANAQLDVPGARLDRAGPVAARRPSPLDEDLVVAAARPAAEAGGVVVAVLVPQAQVEHGLGDGVLGERRAERLVAVLHLEPGDAGAHLERKVQVGLGLAGEGGAGDDEVGPVRLADGRRPGVASPPQPAEQAVGRQARRRTAPTTSTAARPAGVVRRTPDPPGCRPPRPRYR